MNARTQDSSEYGVKGLTEVYLLQRFDIIEGFSCDYMHSCILGVTRQFVFLWCESTGIPYYLGREIDNIDERIKKLRLPTGIGRMLV